MIDAPRYMYVVNNQCNRMLKYDIILTSYVYTNKPRGTKEIVGLYNIIYGCNYNL
jgi:hypothetical protein